MADVHEGEDGWLFLTGGTNQVLRFYTEPDFFTERDTRAWAALLRERADRLSRRRYRHLVVPDKLSVMAPRFGAELPHFDRRPLAQLRALAPEYGLQTTLLDCTEALAIEPGPFRSFYKTDSHWTIWGAYLGYREICRGMGLDPAAIAPFQGRPFAQLPVTFDLGGKLDPPRTEVFHFTPIPPGVSRSAANAIVELRDEAERSGTPAPMHHGAHVVFSNERPGRAAQRLVVFGDSFVDYRPSTLLGLLAETFAETHFIWSSSIDYDYIERVQPDCVLTEIAERFMTVIPSDDYQVEAAAAARMAEYRAQLPRP